MMMMMMMMMQGCGADVASASSVECIKGRPVYLYGTVRSEVQVSRKLFHI